MAEETYASDRVIIVGAGPVGSVLALALRRHGIPILLIDQLAAPERDCRAASCHPPTIAMLERLGLLEDGLEQGLVSPIFHYLDRVTGELVGRFALPEMQAPPAHPYVLQWEQYKIADTVEARLRTDPGARIEREARLFAVEQTEDGVIATVERADGSYDRLRGAYLVGCDGGRSTVRKLADISFEGFTWPERFIKIDTRHDFTAMGPQI